MSLYSNLPIYNSVFFLLKDLYLRVPQFSKQYKYLLGEKMLVCCTESIVLIVKISNSRDKPERIVLVDELQEHMNRLLIYVRIAGELNQLPKKSSYFYLAEKVLDVLNQASNWKKFLQKK